jgi:hypothetical protein
MPPRPQLAQRLRDSREEAAALLSFSPRSLDYAIEHRRIRVKREGARVFILHSELIGYSKENHPASVRERPGQAT